MCGGGKYGTRRKVWPVLAQCPAKGCRVFWDSREEEVSSCHSAMPTIQSQCQKWIEAGMPVVEQLFGLCAWGNGAMVGAASCYWVCWTCSVLG